ncbi:MAG: Ig-like domain-containing protein [Bacillales bacterium]|nr:Ig-like domain-containing protein [Bacillales bacterium]
MKKNLSLLVLLSLLVVGCNPPDKSSSSETEDSSSIEDSSSTDLIYPTSVTITSEEEGPLNVGETRQLNVVTVPIVVSNPQVTYTSSNSSVATVTEHGGLVTAIAVGHVFINATVDGVGTNYELDVQEVVHPLTVIVNSNSSDDLIVGSKRTLTVSTIPAIVSFPNPEWTSSDETIATVNNGVVTAVSVGNATISAEIDNVVGDYLITVSNYLVDTDENSEYIGDIMATALNQYSGNTEVTVPGFPGGSSLSVEQPKALNGKPLQFKIGVDEKGIERSVRNMTTIAGKELYEIEVRYPRSAKKAAGDYPTILDNKENPAVTYEVGDLYKDKFGKYYQAINNSTNQLYDLPLVVAAVSEHAVIWTETSDSSIGFVSTHAITTGTANSAATLFDEAYVIEQQYYGDGYDANRDGKLALIYYDIQDGYEPNGNSGYIAGYFAPSDLSSGLNNTDCINIDTYPGSGAMINTIVHEYVHLINESVWLRNNYTEDFDSWAEEGMAESASQTYQWFKKGVDGNPAHSYYLDRMSYYNGSQALKNNDVPLTNHGYHGNTLENYSLAWAWFQYLRLLTQDYEWGGYNLFRTIEDQPYKREKLYTLVIIPKLIEEDPSYAGYKFVDLLIDFKLALTLNKVSGKYGWGGDSHYSFTPYYFTQSSSVLVPGIVHVRKYSNVKAYTLPSNRRTNTSVVALNSHSSGFIYLKTPSIPAVVGSSTEYKVTVYDTNKAPITSGVSFSASNDRASVDNEGRVTFNRMGQVEITATYQGYTNSETIDISDTTYTLNWNETSQTELYLGTDYDFTLTINPDPNGHKSDEVLFSVGDTYVASIANVKDGDGHVIGIRVHPRHLGATYITATLGTASVNLNFEVVEEPFGQVILSILNRI